MEEEDKIIEIMREIYYKHEKLKDEYFIKKYGSVTWDLFTQFAMGGAPPYARFMKDNLLKLTPEGVREYRRLVETKRQTNKVKSKSHETGRKAELELIRLFQNDDFCVIPAKGSGSVTNCPDILVFKRGMQFSLEVKLKNSNNLYISILQFRRLMRWEETSGINSFIAWKRKGETCIFIPLSLLKKTKTHYSITWKDAQQLGRNFEDFLV